MNPETIRARVPLRWCFSLTLCDMLHRMYHGDWQADNWGSKAENVASVTCWGIRAALGSVFLGSAESKRRSDADVAGGHGLSLLFLFFYFLFKLKVLDSC